MFKWEPKEDITPWELAQCIKLLVLLAERAGKATGRRVYDEMSDGAKRHLVDLEEDPG